MTAVYLFFSTFDLTSLLLSVYLPMYECPLMFVHVYEDSNASQDVPYVPLEIDLDNDRFASSILIGHCIGVGVDVLQVIRDLVSALCCAFWYIRSSRPAELMLPAPVRPLHQAHLVLLQRLTVHRYTVAKCKDGAAVVECEAFESKCMQGQPYSEG